MKIGKLRSWWILFWFNDLTRVLLVLYPGHFLITLPVMISLGVQGETLRSFAIWSYVAVLCWAFVDNDYETNLKKVGLDPYRNPL